MTHIKTYCLAPPEIPWRRPVAEERFRRAGLTVEWFEGVHAPTLGLQARLPVHDSPGYVMPPGQVGIFLTMTLLFHILMERREEEVLVLENDAEPCDGFLEEFGRSYAALPADWQIVHVGSCCANDKPAERINDRVSRIRYPSCTHAMLYKKSVLPFLLERMRRTCSTKFDTYINEVVLPHAKHYVFDPQLVGQPPITSEIGIGTTGPMTWESIPGWFDWQQIADEQIDHRQKTGGVFVEIGSYLGRSTAYVAERIKWRLAPIEFHVVDTWRGSANEPAMRETLARFNDDLYDQWQQNMSRAGVLPYVIPHRMTSLEAAATFHDGSVDWVYIDGDHSYESVKADILAWRPKVRRASKAHHGGTLSGHDIDRPDVRRAVEEVFRGRWRRWQGSWIVDGGK